MIRVLVADDHLAVREGLHALLAKEKEIAIVGEADDGSTALELARRLKPDLVVLDDSMPGISSLDVARALGAELPGTAVVFLARDPGMRDLALAAGATAFVSKDAPSAELLRALRASAAAVTARQQLSALRPEGRRVVELLLGSRVMTGEQVQEALAKRASGESLATTVVRLGLLGQPELADILARATDTPFVSLAPYPEISAPIDPTESRLSSPRLVDPVEREAARSVPMDVARGLGIVVTAADRGHGVVAMADPLDDAAFAEAERHSRLRLTRVTATADDVKDTLDRVWNGGGSREVIWTGNLLSKVYASLVLGVIVVAAFGGFGLIFRDALAPHFAFSLFALLCGLFFFLYALKYYVTIASVILITLFGDPAKFQGKHGNGHANGNGNGNGLKADGQSNGNAHTNGQHKEGYRTLRGEKLSESGVVVVNDPWQKMGEIRLSADRQPFVSIHLALYNEGRVVDRLLEACTSFDYENYEVIVADDSTDETVEKLKKWKEHPRVRVIHRSSRKGFKGGALQEALRRMNPRTEYVMVFDADFVPPADAIWHFLDYFGRLTKPKSGNGNGHDAHAKTGAPTNGDRLAVVQGYQWHMLNASENWVTKGVRAEFSGSYVLERAGQELFGAMKMISGSVYMIRADVLRKLGWSTSITEDWELTIRLYLAGYKVLYTPYIQAPAECVSEVRRLIKQRMRWAEGHTFNVRKYFWPILRSPNLSWQEKLEFVYYAPYYLQSVLFTVATVSWIVGVLILGQKLPMWGEIFGWSLVVSNALALPLMNLTGVLLEGSLKRDALGLLSFIGLSWILVPFQAYASLKALFEKKEGGWVRTPKSGRVTESLERFHLARLMPWELPRRKRGQGKTPSASSNKAAAAVVVFTAAFIITVGALSIRAAATSGVTGETDLAVPALLGTMVPLVILALGWLRLRRRMTAIVLAFTLGLGTNVVFLAHAVPASAVTDNSSVFTFARTTGYVPANTDMKQNYSPSGASTTCPAAGTICTHFSDQFTTGQTLNAGTASADLYLSSSVPTITFRGGGNSFIDSTVCAPTWPGNSGMVAKGDVMIAACAFRGGSAVTITPPDASWIPLTRIDNGTTISLATFYHVVATSYETTGTGNIQFTLGSSQKNANALYSYTGVDNTNPIDVQNGQATSTGTSHAALGVTTTTANDLLITFHAVAGSTSNTNQWTPPAAMSERGENSIATGSNASNASLEGNELLLGAAGAIGNQTASSAFSGLGATKTIALRPATTCTVTATVKKVNPIWLRATTTKTVTSGTSIVLDVPAGTQQNDVMYAYLAYSPLGASITAPVGWTQGSSSSATGLGVWTFRRVASAAEPANYTWTFNNASTIAGWAGSYVGVDTTTPTDTTTQNSDTGTTHVTSTKLIGLEDEMVILGVAIAGNVTYTSVSGMTAEGNPIAGTSTFASLGMFDGIQGARTYINRTTTSSASGSADNVMLTLRPATPATTLGSGSVTINLPSGTTLASTGSFSTSAATFTTGDRLELDLVASSACSGSLSYDGASEPSKLTMATIVPEGVAGLLLLAPALPLGLRWWKRRRP